MGMKIPAYEVKHVQRLAITADAGKVGARELETRLRESGDTENATRAGDAAQLFEVTSRVLRRLLVATSCIVLVSCGGEVSLPDDAGACVCITCNNPAPVPCDGGAE